MTSNNTVMVDCMDGTRKQAVFNPWYFHLKIAMDPELPPTAEVWSTRESWVVIMIEYPDGSKDPELRERCIQWV